MKDWDAERLAPKEHDRSFTLAGHQFTYQVGVRPEVIARYFDAGSVGMSNAETVAVYDETVEAFLEADSRSTWRKVREIEGEDAVTLADITKLIGWLIEEQASRPTSAPSGSSNGRETPTTGTHSTVEPASAAATSTA